MIFFPSSLVLTSTGDESLSHEYAIPSTAMMEIRYDFFMSAMLNLRFIDLYEPAFIAQEHEFHWLYFLRIKANINLYG
jgi:hypothetical protein